MTVILFVLY